MCYDVCRQVVRIAALVALLMLYLLAASSHELLPPVVRAVLVALFAVVAAHKMFVLTVSLPPHRPPPRHACIRKFFVADDRKLAMHIAEASAMVICLAFACAVRTLPFVFFLPVGVASLMPIGRMCALHPSLACVKRAVRLLMTILLSPVLVLIGLAVLVYRYPRRAVHPLDAGVHIFAALAAVPLCLGPVSNVPVVVLWGVHSIFLAAGFMEILFVKKLQWVQGPLWWVALQVSVLSAYVADTFCEFPRGLKTSGSTELTVGLVSCTWLVLAAALTISVNWALCMQYYRTWQSRNGTFTLQVSGNQASDGATGP